MAVTTMARRLKTIARAYIFPADSAIVKSSIPKRQVRTTVITTAYYEESDRGGYASQAKATVKSEALEVGSGGGAMGTAD